MTTALSTYARRLNDVPVPTDTYLVIEETVVHRDGVETTWRPGTVIYKPDEWGGDAALHKDFTSDRPALRSSFTDRIPSSLLPLRRVLEADLKEGDLAVARWNRLTASEPSHYTLVVSEDTPPDTRTFHGRLLLDGEFDFDADPTGMTFTAGTNGQVWRVPLRTHTFPASDSQPGQRLRVLIDRPQGAGLTVGEEVTVLSVETSVDGSIYFTVRRDGQTEGHWAVYPSSVEKVDTPVDSRESDDPTPDDRTAEAEQTDQRIRDLEAQVQALRDENARLLHQWSEQTDRMGLVFMEAAVDNDLCSVYDNTVDRVNEFLRFPLPLREQDFHVCFSVAGTTTITLVTGGIEFEVDVDWTGAGCTSASARNADDVSTDDLDVSVSDLESIEVQDVNTGYIYDHAEVTERVREAMQDNDVSGLEIVDIDSE